MFYWHFESRSDSQKDPLVFWLTGGPGCSSVTALFAENGPYKIRDDLNLTKNPYSWNEHSNIVYVDQPVGTGFSKAGLNEFVVDENGVAADFFQFLQDFYTLFPQYAGREMFVTGESYAGHYIPAITAKIVTEKDTRMNLVGVAIGNGLVDPYNQYQEYVNYAYENNLIGNIQYVLLKGAFYICKQMIKYNIPFVLTMKECQMSVEAIMGNPMKPKFNKYDIREKCDVPPRCYDFSQISKFLMRQDVIGLLGVQGRQWANCKDDVRRALYTDWMLNLSPKITLLLDIKINILVYTGDKDFICNWRGGEKWTNNVQWAKKEEFQKAEYKKWYSFGEIKSVDNLHFLRVYDAGHMVPMNKPEASLKMINQFYSNIYLTILQIP
ncbi:serine carboxypeptidase family protein, putative [Ichthyophthirius multifiliis]|uniref:Carboxypeptidase n=1 Tax=Ichthyophthirius multifiliis TaxID=5932 RepID=G0QPV7_ICHMU|nr:serine carboxypeptidase family protein, putative [Ichthyophthirius multifiliis]EGR32735.1 serine carboxypeptidase family protein, putative [Ichthyophthirius multifiliis]|eukprot:XP_004036721.1 serine carboxypeptidase family protein, putative [Ichthyophthirius multifiliis]